MSQKKPRRPRSPIKPPEQEMFVTWDEGDVRGRALAMNQAAKALSRAEPIVRTQGSDTFADAGGNGINIRDGFSREDYDTYRGDEAIPRAPKGIMRACMSAYEQVGIVHNVIDLMADFATQGIDLYHQNERIERFYQEWFRRVRGKERSERFLNALYGIGNVIVHRTTAKLPQRVEEEMRRARGAPDVSAEELPKLGTREIPWEYTFLNPLHVNVLGDELAVFIGRNAFTFALIIPESLKKKVKNPNKSEKDLVARLPKLYMDAIRKGDPYIPLDRSKVRGFYYKKKDWELWAKPMTYSILADLQLLKKMKLADAAALDGAVSCIRVWKLGNIEHRILPTEAAINKLAEMLMNNVGGGVMDLVWGPEIDLIETSTEVHRFLGQTKYEPCLTAVYAGLGIPPTLTGADAKGGFTNNFISLKTLTERLQYGRQILAEFWDEEIRLVQKAMGFRFPATLVFDRMTLTDEAAEKQLLLNLWDRGLVSDESVVMRFGEEPAIEEARVRRDQRKRENGQKPPKASPYHDPQQEFHLKKIFAQTGVISPSEAGVELEEKDDKSLLDQQGELTVKQTKLQNQGKQAQMDHEHRTNKLELKHGVHPNQIQQQVNKTKVGSAGRPPGAKDGQKRKQKQVQPRTSAEFFQAFAWAENAQARIGQVASPAYLKALGKENCRQLTEKEAADFEAYKFFVLCQLDVNAQVDEQAVARISAGKLEIPVQVNELLRATVTKHVEKTGKEPSIEVLRRYQAGAYAMWRVDCEEAGGPDDGSS